MYIKYTVNPKSADPVDTTAARLNATGGTYRPTWLIRTSDWQRVPGTEATNGYCTISYSWDQSGEVVQRQDGDYDCIDNGLHEIIQITKTKRKRKILQFLLGSHKKTVVKRVTFDVLLRQLCKDFGIDYLWYDKLCIDQKDKKAKMHEIKQMHLVYGNARFTAALVPEMKADNASDFDSIDIMWGTLARCEAIHELISSEWWKRSWTLEEAMVSKRILLIGSNLHLWQQSLNKDTPTVPDLFSGYVLDFGSRERQSVNQVLRYAHFRTSSKEHDKVFALANIFHKVIRIEVDYDQDVHTAMRNFYRSIAAIELP